MVIVSAVSIEYVSSPKVEIHLSFDCQSTRRPLLSLHFHYLLASNFYMFTLFALSQSLLERR